MRGLIETGYGVRLMLGGDIARRSYLRAYGGVRVIEVPMMTPGALKVIETAAAKFTDDVLFGAGSVLDTEAARMAILYGAGFIVAPTPNLDMIKLFPASFGGTGPFI